MSKRFLRSLCVSAWLSSALLTLACTPAAEQAPPRSAAGTAAEYPGVLLSPVTFGANFQWRQQITATWKTGSRSFDAVLSKDGNELQLIGLSPMGMPGFVLKLNDQKVSVENHTDQAMPFPARYVLLDTERVFFPWFPATTKDSQTASLSGPRRLLVNGEEVTEYWQAGVLQRRVFRRLDGVPSGEIVITYSGWSQAHDAPDQVLLENGWFGYSLKIQTVDQVRLP